MINNINFFFLMNKETCIDRKKQQAAQKYIGGIQKGRSPKKDQKHEKKKKKNTKPEFGIKK